MNKEESGLKEAQRIMRKYKCGFHQWGDYKTKEENELAGHKLCERCDGTGNELFSMYRRCPDCFGSGRAVLAGEELKGAHVSEDGKYRYNLWRLWGSNSSVPVVIFIGLNPSTADATQDDPTIRRCRNFAKMWGYRGMYMMNLFAFRAKNPKALNFVPDPVGPDNEFHFNSVTVLNPRADVVFCWGAYPEYLSRMLDVCNYFPAAKYIEITKEGFPRHPLYLKKDCNLNNFDESRRKVLRDLFRKQKEKK